MLHVVAAKPKVGERGGGGERSEEPREEALLGSVSRASGDSEGWPPSFDDSTPVR